ncbi:MAG: ATP-binding cassette domain-containing protein [Muribaculaceae bacterium]|nr:ATP-binding cassette domain-containing protein [Muribaculaceae bacterium]
MFMLEIKDVSKSYSGHQALTDISFEVPEGGIYGLLGPNGAGKTTLIRIINHITAPDKGEVMFDGHRLTQKDVVNIGYLPEERGLYKKMKVGEQALFFARLKGMSKNEANRELRKWFEKFEISDWWNRKVEELSKGMAQKVQFIVTVLHNPRLLIFDEPFSGFDPINANLLKEEMLALRDKGTTIIFSTHNMNSVETLCDNITLINKSRNILSGNVDEIRKEQGKGRFALTFKGSPERLLDALQQDIVSHEIIVPDKNITDVSTNLILKLKPETSFRDIISLANNIVELESFSRALPSMDEIFINAVKNANQNE